MRKIKINNLANYSRQVQYYKTNRYVVVGPKASIELVCADDNDIVELSYYVSLGRKQFKVEICDTKDSSSDTLPKIESNIERHKAPKVIEQETVPYNKEVENNTVETEMPIIEDDFIEDKNILSEKEDITEDTIKEISYDDLTEQQLKQILINMGVQSTVRARRKLIDLIELNMPDGKSLRDYI